MDINFKNLNSFETVGIVLAAVGIIFGFLFMFYALPQNQQNYISAASASIFDLHDGAVAEVQAVGSIFDSTHLFLNQFSVAFTEVATLPPSELDFPHNIIAATKDAISATEQLAANYNPQTYGSNTGEYISGGEVLGAMIDLSGQFGSDQSQPSNNSPPLPPELQMPYSYNPPVLNLHSLNFVNNY